MSEPTKILTSLKCSNCGHQMDISVTMKGYGGGGGGSGKDKKPDRTSKAKEAFLAHVMRKQLGMG